MKTAKNWDRASINMDDAALTLAIAVIAERIRGLAKEDRDDLYELSRVIFANESTEEVESAKRAFREILDQRKAQIQSFCATELPVGLDGWLAFVSQQIKSARESAGLTQGALESLTGLPQSHISRLENGVHSPSSVTLEKIARATNQPMSFFDPSHECEPRS